MLLSRSIRRQHALRAVNHNYISNLPPPPLLSSPRRHLNTHERPKLTHEAEWNAKGIDRLFTPGGFDLAWNQYQSYILSKLSKMMSGHPSRYADTKSILLQYARDAEKASLFNHASMAHNNHFFFAGISNKPTEIPKALLTEINTSFSSLDSLRATFIATADAMFGPGFVWLIKKNVPLYGYSPPGQSPGKLSILTTYLAGSPYPGAHFRRQGVDMAITDNGLRAGDTPSNYAAREYGLGSSLNSVGSFGDHAKGAKTTAPGGQDLEVLMCVSTWEHTWLRDWGYGKKRNFLESWWRMIDWEKVQHLMEPAGDRKEKLRTQSAFYR